MQHHRTRDVRRLRNRRIYRVRARNLRARDHTARYLLWPFRRSHLNHWGRRVPNPAHYTVRDAVAAAHTGHAGHARNHRRRSFFLDLLDILRDLGRSMQTRVNLRNHLDRLDDLLWRRWRWWWRRRGWSRQHLSQCVLRQGLGIQQRDKNHRPEDRRVESKRTNHPVLGLGLDLSTGFHQRVFKHFQPLYREEELVMLDTEHFKFVPSSQISITAGYIYHLRCGPAQPRYGRPGPQKIQPQNIGLRPSPASLPAAPQPCLAPPANPGKPPASEPPPQSRSRSRSKCRSPTRKRSRAAPLRRTNTTTTPLETSTRTSIRFD